MPYREPAFFADPAAVIRKLRGINMLGIILVVLLIIFLVGGFSGRFGGYGYGLGHGGIGIGGVLLIIVIFLLLTGRL